VQKQVLIDASLSGKLSNDEEMPLLVVLLKPAFPDPVEDATGKFGIRMGVSNRHVGDILPGLIRYSGNNLEHLEFRQTFLPSV
jgi:hypothetical protein